MKLKSSLIILLLSISLNLVSGCIEEYIAKSDSDVITNFEEFNLKDHADEKITVYGEAVKINLLYSTDNYDTFYGIRDDNGFKIEFIPRGGRYIEVGEDYTITGIVIMDTKTSPLMHPPRVEEVYFLLEVKE